MQIPWKGHFKSGKSSVLQARNRSFVRRGFRRRFLFSFQAQSCLRLFRTLPLTLLRQTASTFIFYLKSCLQSQCVFNCRRIVFLTNPIVCLKSVFRPKKNSFSWASSEALHKFTAVVGNFLSFEAFFWHLLFGGSFQALQPSA